MYDKYYEAKRDVVKAVMRAICVLETDDPEEILEYDRVKLAFADLISLYITG